MSTPSIIDPRTAGAPATPPAPPGAGRWPGASQAAGSQRELVQLSLLLCPGAEEARA